MNDIWQGTWLRARGVLVTGANPADFLQGYLTCDVDRFAHAATLPMALCNLKGRVTVSGWVHDHGDEKLELIVHASLAERVIDVLSPYARFSRCALGLNPQHPTVARTAQAGFIDNLHLTAAANASASDVSDSIDAILIEHRFAWLSAENSEKFLPQALGLPDQAAVDFAKGCYLGQEIVARAQFRGQVKRQLVEFHWSGAPPVPGSRNKDGQTVIAVAAPHDDPSHGSGLAVA